MKKYRLLKPYTATSGSNIEVFPIGHIVSQRECATHLYFFKDCFYIEFSIVENNPDWFQKIEEPRVIWVYSCKTHEEELYLGWHGSKAEADSQISCVNCKVTKFIEVKE
jgi:hypothetical protein